MLLHFDVNGGHFLRGSYSPDYIDHLLKKRNSTERGLELCIRIESLIAVLSLCIACYSLGYNRGKHDAKTEKMIALNLSILSDHFLFIKYQVTVISVAPFSIIIISISFFMSRLTPYKLNILLSVIVQRLAGH